MVSAARQLDELLRGKMTSPERLSEGQVDLHLRGLVPMAIVLGAAYGFFMGLYALALYWRGITPGQPERCWQILSSMVKLPALFILTLAVTFPSLYVFNAMFGGRLGFTAALRLITGSVVTHSAIAASFGPILGFFTINTTNYSFMVVLNLAFIGVAGVVALIFLLHTLGHVSGQAKAIFWIWLLIFGIVGAQMGWLFRPFIGSPDLPFVWFRSTEGNFLEGAWLHIHRLLGMQ